MALDGIFVRHIAEELRRELIGAKINQVHQPSRDELVISLHTRSLNRRLLISARADSPRISLTDHRAENPQVAPMFCMLMRKKLCGARVVDVRQHSLERMLFIDLDAATTLGDRTNITLAIEIMGKHSNCILVDEQGIIVDSLKRIDMTLSSKRLVLPALKYELPPSQGKLSLLEDTTDNILNKILSFDNTTLDKAILSAVMGISPIVCREISHRATGCTDAYVGDLSFIHKEALRKEIESLSKVVGNTSGRPCMLKDLSGKPFDLTFTEITQYGASAAVQEFDTFSQLLDSYYFERDSIERMRVKSRDLAKLIANNIQRLSRKINVQTGELEKSKDRETLRIYADLLQANLYRIEKGASFADVENFYDENMGTVRIKLDPSKSPSWNAQKYYKDYARAKTADKMLRIQIAKAQSELEYLETVADEINRAESERELTQIRQELIEGGYIRSPKGKQKPPKELSPREFTVSEGFVVLVGRNNRQNDMLTLKLSAKNDVWLHTKDIPGSHTVIRSEGKDVPLSVIEEAARICAWYSKAKDGAQVPVDYTLIRHVSKPQGSPPGKVIYTDQRTLFVTPHNPEKD